MAQAQSDAPSLAAITIRNLTKRYGQIRAVNNLTLDVHTGEILGFLGLNGAGKTTTIRILLDLLRPSSGRAQIFGSDCQSQGLAARAAIGYLPGEMGVYADLTGAEVLRLLGGLGVRAVPEPYRRELQDKLEFSDSVLQRKLREYSTGMKRKLGLIQALQSDPPLLILDEPTEGLDPLMQEAFYGLLMDLRKRGRTVFMSSHVLSEVERVCDRIALLRKGELVLLSTVQEARGLAARRVRVYFSQNVACNASMPAQYELISVKPDSWELRAEGELGPLLQFLQGYPVRDLQIEQPKLEEELVRYYRENVT